MTAVKEPTRRMAEPAVGTRNGWIVAGMDCHKDHNRRRRIPCGSGFRWRHATARVVLAVLFINTLVPIWLGQQGIAALSSTNGRRDTAGWETVLLCTASGLKLVRYGETREPAPEGGDQSDFCVLCLPFYNLGGGVSSPSVILKPANFLHDPQPAPADAGMSRQPLLSGSACPRAPPFQV